MAKLSQTIVAPNGDQMEISFDYLKPSGDIENLKVHVWNKERTQGFDLTDLFDTKELSWYADQMIKKITTSI